MRSRISEDALRGFIKSPSTPPAQVHFPYKLKSDVMEYHSIRMNNCLPLSSRRRAGAFNGKWSVWIVLKVWPLLGTLSKKKPKHFLCEDIWYTCQMFFPPILTIHRFSIHTTIAYFTTQKVAIRCLYETKTKMWWIQSRRKRGHFGVGREFLMCWCRRTSLHVLYNCFQVYLPRGHCWELTQNKVQLFVLWHLVAICPKHISIKDGPSKQTRTG